MTVQRMNYTNRLKLKREHLQISLGQPDASGISRFELGLKLPESLPTDAGISLEAYSSSPPIQMRFNLGTVDKPRTLTEEERRLTDFGKGAPTPLFRLKIIDRDKNDGRLIADRSQIRPITPEEKKDNRQGLLYIDYMPLGGPVWELEPERAGFEPTLWLDPSADPLQELPRDPRFIALVFPEVIRRVLTHLIIDEEMNGIDGEGMWGVDWFKLASNLPGMVGNDLPREENEDEGRREWISEAASSFAGLFNVCDLINPQQQENEV
tara:strand:+ start:63710 stop:64507 length:798 start_codon:yes stop_codon:yes gene_type:complete